MMGREVGCKKYGGRRKGTPNKRTQELLKFFEDIDFHVPSKVIELLPELDKEKQADILVKLMSYLYPKRKAIETSSESSINVHKHIIEAIKRAEVDP